ncbi:MAG: FtsW/RodA/SpoVE family cell cycle protein [Clostridia bacterium]|nr:FtsW/RodA/SpoVE family cell cycle protein [Clostridia bacterium]
MRTFFNKFRIIVKETNKTLLLMCIALTVFGLILIQSATMNQLQSGDTISRSVLTTAIASIAGLVACIVISLFEHDFIVKFWPVIGFVCLALMGSLFIFGCSPSGRDDAFSWLKFGSFYFQPSELLKVGFVITFSVHLDTVKDELDKFKNIVYLGMHAMVAVGLVILTGDLGSALVFMVTTIGLLFLAGVQLRYFAIGAVAVGLATPVIWYEFLSDFQKQRFLAVYNPSQLTESTYKTVIYQQQQGLSAIGAGRLTGQGLFNGTYTQAGLVPESQNDMIFSVVGEELGFIGCIALLLFIMLIIIKIVSIGRKSINNVGRLMCYGVALIIAAQTIINVGMCIKVMPVIGITLPFLSSGGSANLCIYFLIGLVLSVYRTSIDRTPTEINRNAIMTPFEEA